VLGRDHRDEAGTGFETGIIKFAVGLFLLKVRSIGGAQESAFVMIEPPGDFRRRRVLEIHNRILVSGEVGFVEQRTGTVEKAGKLELDVTADPLAVKAGK